MQRATEKYLTISIVLTNYNNALYLNKSISSVLNQTYSDIELIIVDDCSNDNSLEIVKGFISKDSRIKLIRNKVNLGAGVSRRIGIQNATGEYTTFLDADDYYSQNHIEMLVKAALDSGCDIIHSGYISEDKNYNLLYVKCPKYKIDLGYDRYRNNSCETKAFLNTSLIKRELWDKVKYSSRRYIEDSPTALKLYHYCNSVLNLNHVGYHYVENPKSLTHVASNAKDNIFRLLCVKELKEFFEDKEDCLKTPDEYFISEFEKFLDSEISDKDLQKYKKELDELYEYYLKLCS